MGEVKLTKAEKVAREAAAYERGWADSLHAYDARSSQPMADMYAYIQGWRECAAYRWADLNGRGIAPDPAYRPAGRTALKETP